MVVVFWLLYFVPFRAAGRLVRVLRRRRGTRRDLGTGPILGRVRASPVARCGPCGWLWVGRVSRPVSALGFVQASSFRSGPAIALGVVIGQGDYWVAVVSALADLDCQGKKGNRGLGALGP